MAIADWSALLSVQAGAAATLTGLVFVAISVNLAKIIAFPGLPGRAAESMLQFLEVFLISTVALIPGQSERALAVEVTVIAFALWFAVMAGQIRYLRQRSRSKIETDERRSPQPARAGGYAHPHAAGVLLFHRAFPARPGRNAAWIDAIRRGEKQRPISRWPAIPST
jgi:hypothetical protein